VSFPSVFDAAGGSTEFVQPAREQAIESNEANTKMRKVIELSVGFMR
jgi:exopolyphosphatase/pppGpp-phosphohydrolase